MNAIFFLYEKGREVKDRQSGIDGSNKERHGENERETNQRKMRKTPIGGKERSVGQGVNFKHITQDEIVSRCHTGSCEERLGVRVWICGLVEPRYVTHFTSPSLSSLILADMILFPASGLTHQI